MSKQIYMLNNTFKHAKMVIHFLNWRVINKKFLWPYDLARHNKKKNRWKSSDKKYNYYYLPNNLNNYYFFYKPYRCFKQRKQYYIFQITRNLIQVHIQTRNRILRVLELLVRKPQESLSPGWDITIDESLLLFKGCQSYHRCKTFHW